MGLGSLLLTKPITWFFLVATILTAMGLGCVSQGRDASITIGANVLIEGTETEPRWFKDFETTKGIDGYELLHEVTERDLVSEWFPQFRSHFVKEIFGEEPQGSEFWGVFVWSETANAWEPLAVGADLFSVKDGHTLAWALVKFDPENQQTPQSSP